MSTIRKLMTFLALLIVMGASVAQAPRPELYRLPLGPAAGHAQEAFDDMPARRLAILRSLACGREDDFQAAKKKFGQANDGEIDSGEDLLVFVLAKLVYVREVEGPCQSAFLNPAVDVSSVQAFEKEFDAGCVDATGQPTPPEIDATHVKISPGCLAHQVNKSLGGMQQGVLKVGSSDIPCDLGDVTKGLGLGKDSTHGEWDTTLRLLLRIAYLDERSGLPPVLDPQTRDHVRKDLLSVSGTPTEETYPIIGCGNAERSTGSDEDRAADSDYEDNALDSIGDAFEWLFKRLLLLGAVMTAGSVIAALAGPFAPLVLSAAAAGVTAVAFLKIPETENHLMQINSAKYLINKGVLDRLNAAGEDTHSLQHQQDATRDWLVRTMQDMLRHDLIEYNALPYQRYTLGALLNLYDFAGDRRVSEAARILLEYHMAKFAVSSSELRRFSPYRRRSPFMSCYLPDGPCKDKQPGVFDMTMGADFMIAMGQYYAGPSRTLVSHDNRFLGSLKSADQMLLPATSDYRPSALLVELTLNKSTEYFQRLRVRDEGAEIYSNSSAILFGGGGGVTAHANPPYVAGISVGGLADLKDDSDKGTGWPIVMFTHNVLGQGSVFPAMRIQGERVSIAGDDASWMLDNNLCLWKNFACGEGLIVPQEIKNCNQSGQPGWLFVDSGACPSFEVTSRTFLVGYLTPVDGRDVGFIEIVGARPQADFADTTRKVLASNPEQTAAKVSVRGIYRTMSGHVIEYDTNVHMRNSQRTGIESIDNVRVPDIGDWPHAEGVINGAWSEALVTINNPGFLAPPPSALPSKLILDLRNVDQPLFQTVP